MSLPVVLRDAARTEFVEAAEWYDARQAGLGLAFVSEIEKALIVISGNALAPRRVFADVRRVSVRRFPYAVYYRTHVDRIEVLAVFHTKRDPLVWQKRS